MLVYETKPIMDAFDDTTQTFYTIPSKRFVFEHSLDSLTEWESVYKKPFLASEKTNEELLDYFTMMLVDGDELTYNDITEHLVATITEYITTPQTATTIRPDESRNGGRRGPIMTSEVIYAYMANAQIPFECSSWNLDRLLTLIGVLSELNNPDKKKSNEAATLRRNAEIMAKRRAERAKGSN